MFGITGGEPDSLAFAWVCSQDDSCSQCAATSENNANLLCLQLIATLEHEASHLQMALKVHEPRTRCGDQMRDIPKVQEAEAP